MRQFLQNMRQVEDFLYLYIDLNFDTLTTKILIKLMEIYQPKDKISFSREADFSHFGVINFGRSQMQYAVYLHLCEHIMKF